MSAHPTLPERIEAELAAAGAEGRLTTALVARLGVPIRQLSNALADLRAHRRIVSQPEHGQQRHRLPGAAETPVDRFLRRTA